MGGKTYFYVIFKNSVLTQYNKNNEKHSKNDLIHALKKNFRLKFMTPKARVNDKHKHLRFKSKGTPKSKMQGFFKDSFKIKKR